MKNLCPALVLAVAGLRSASHSFAEVIDQNGPCRSVDECLNAALKNPMCKEALQLK